MKNLKILLSLSILILSALFFYGCSSSDCDNSATFISPTQPTQKGSISGTILDVQNAPVANATVSLIGSKASITTGNDGKYAFTNLDLGEYKLNVRVMANASSTPPDGADITAPLLSTATRNITLTEADYNKIEDFALKNASISGNHSIINNNTGQTSSPAWVTVTLYDSEGNSIQALTGSGGTEETYRFRLQTFLPQTYSKIHMLYTSEGNDYTTEKSNITILDSTNPTTIVNLQITTP